MAALSSSAGASPGSQTSALSPEELDGLAAGPVMFIVQDAARGEVAVLHGENQVIVRDPQLVARVLRAANVNGKVR